MNIERHAARVHSLCVHAAHEHVALVPRVRQESQREGALLVDERQVSLRQLALCLPVADRSDLGGSGHHAFEEEDLIYKPAVVVEASQGTQGSRGSEIDSEVNNEIDSEISSDIDGDIDSEIEFDIDRVKSLKRYR